MSQIKNGKRPLSQRPKEQVLTSDDVFGSALTVPPELQEEIKAAGFAAWRFVDAKKLYSNQGYHDKGWVVYKRRSTNGTISSSEFKFGSDPDGVIRRGSLILAVKTEEQITKHRTYLKQKADRYHATAVKNKASELKQLAQQGNVDLQIHEGYDEND